METPLGFVYLGGGGDNACGWRREKGTLRDLFFLFGPSFEWRGDLVGGGGPWLFIRRGGRGGHAFFRGAVGIGFVADFPF